MSTPNKHTYYKYYYFIDLFFLWTLEVLVLKKYQFIFMSHVLINYYRPKTNTGEVEFNLIDI